MSMASLGLIIYAFFCDNKKVKYPQSIDSYMTFKCALEFSKAGENLKIEYS